MHQPDPIAQLDQALAGTRDFAKGAATFYRELRDQGIDDQAAVELTNGYVAAIVVATVNGDGTE